MTYMNNTINIKDELHMKLFVSKVHYQSKFWALFEDNLNFVYHVLNYPLTSLILKTDIGVSNLNKGIEEESTVCDELFFRTAWSKEKRKKDEIKTKEEWKVAWFKINFPKKYTCQKIKEKWKKVERKMKAKNERTSRALRGIK